MVAELGEHTCWCASARQIVIGQAAKPLPVATGVKGNPPPSQLIS